MSTKEYTTAKVIIGPEAKSVLADAREIQIDLDLHFKEELLPNIHKSGSILIATDPDFPDRIYHMYDWYETDAFVMFKDHKDIKFYVASNSHLDKFTKEPK